MFCFQKNFFFFFFSIRITALCFAFKRIFLFIFFFYFLIFLSIFSGLFRHQLFFCYFFQAIHITVSIVFLSAVCVNKIRLFAVCVNRIHLFAVCVNIINWFAVCVNKINLFAVCVNSINQFAVCVNICTFHPLLIQTFQTPIQVPPHLHPHPPGITTTAQRLQTFSLLLLHHHLRSHHPRHC